MRAGIVSELTSGLHKRYRQTVATAYPLEKPISIYLCMKLKVYKRGRLIWNEEASAHGLHDACIENVMRILCRWLANVLRKQCRQTVASTYNSCNSKVTCSCMAVWLNVKEHAALNAEIMTDLTRVLHKRYQEISSDSSQCIPSHANAQASRPCVAWKFSTSAVWV